MRTVGSTLARARAGDFADWSDKLDVRQSRETTFNNGSYAQQNRILFGNNELLKSQATGSLAVGNGNLSATKDLFTLATESTVAGAITINPGTFTGVAQPDDIDPRYTSDDGAGFQFVALTVADIVTILYAGYRASKTHVVQLQSSASTGTVQLADVAGSPTVVDASLLYAAVGQGPQYYIDRYYAGLESNILNRTRVIEASFNLTPADIENLDLLRPVYIASYGDFFYIQKISNYQARRLTRVTLVCLNLAGTTYTSGT